MDTIASEVHGRRRRKHSAEFKAQTVAACRPPGISIASVAMANGVNANLLRRWIIDAERSADPEVSSLPTVPSNPTAPRSTPAFVALQLAPDAAPADIRIELRRGSTVISVAWPANAVSQCAAWMRELLR